MPDARRRPPRPLRGNLAGCAVPSTIIGIAGSARLPFPRPRGPRRCADRPDARSRASVVRMVAAVSSSSARPAEKCARIADRACGRHREAPRLRERSHQRRGPAAASRPTGLEQQPLEIRRHLDVHRGRRGRDDLAHLIGAGRERARQDVVDVGGDHQPIDRQAHALRRHSPRRCRRNCRSAP